METKDDDINLRTDEVNELLAAEPRWIYRWGIMVVFILMVIGLLLSGFIKYSDTLVAKTTLTTLNPPASLLAKADGKIAGLFVKNDQLVKKNEVLLAIENAAKVQDVRLLGELAETLKSQLTTEGSVLPAINLGGLELGPVTTVALQFSQDYNSYKLYSEVNPQMNELKIVAREMGIYTSLSARFASQEEIAKQELDYVQKDLERNSALFKDGSISAKEHEDKYMEFLNAKRNYENIKINSLNNRITLNNLEKTKLQLEIRCRQEGEELFHALQQSIQELQSAIAAWDEKYILRSPIEGKVSLFNYWSVNQNLRTGEMIMTIVPVKKEALLARVILPIHNSGKLKIGQMVNIKLDNYPYQEFGVLQGYVKHISEMPSDNSYSVEVELPEKLTTSYKKDLEYKEEMQGVAEIVTEELSVLDRIFFQFRKLVGN